MKRVILALIASICLLTACNKELETAIFLGEEPISPENLSPVNRYPTFKPYQRIYYILLSKEAIECPKLRLQVLRLDLKYPCHKIEPVYGIDFNRGENKHYIADYLTVHKEGTYVIRIFSHDNFKTPIAETEFLVQPL